mmetsp:Transcript_22911/g.58446  ORF Transcript_22911/g.58446 Transcript_22911/m.58446 type:complete len:510 (+) Transcript_22911:138-1667(+)
MASTGGASPLSEPLRPRASPSPRGGVSSSPSGFLSRAATGLSMRGDYCSAATGAVNKMHDLVLEAMMPKEAQAQRLERSRTAEGSERSMPRASSDGPGRSRPRFTSQTKSVLPSERLTGTLEKYYSIDEDFGAKSRRSGRDLLVELWNEHAHEESPQLLRELVIAPDGGLRRSELRRLLPEQTKWMKWLFALQLLVCVVVNTLYILYQDLNLIVQNYNDAQGSGHGSFAHKFLFSRPILAPVVSMVLNVFGINLHHLRDGSAVVICELAVLIFWLSEALYRLFIAVFGQEEPVKWHAASQLCWKSIPWLGSFSLMRVLYHLTPSVLATEVSLEIGFLQERWADPDYDHSFKRSFFAVAPLLLYVVTRLLGLAVGVDAFLVKFRAAEQYVNAEDYVLRDMLGSVVFLFQVLGVVNVSMFSKQRLSIFIFGGEDGEVTYKENAVQEVWGAMMAKRVWDELGPIDFMVVMLSFSDYDFQLLMLDDSKEGQEAKKATRAQRRHVDYARPKMME